MKLHYHDDTGRFTCECTFEEKDIPKAARFRWNPKAKEWWTADPEKAARLIEFAVDDRVAKQLAIHAEANAAREAKAEELRELSRATDAAIDVPAPDGMEYLPFQRAGIAFGLQRSNVILADEMGLGKTIEALGIINADPSIRKVLIVCPASLKLNWKREAEDWLVRPMRIAIARSGARWPGPIADIVIINYDILKRFSDRIRSTEWDLLIADEAHYCKNPEAQRTKQVLGDKHWDRKKRKEVVELEPIPARRKLFLTGTPITNRPREIWPLAHAAAPETFPKFWDFARRYCDAQQGRYGWDLTGASNLDELQAKLRGSCLIRRLKADVLTELPPKRRQIIELECNGAQGAVDRENAAFTSHEEKLAGLRAAVELAKAHDDPGVYNAAVGRLRDAVQVAFTEMSRLRHETALEKMPQVAAHALDLLESNGKLVLFAHHKDVVAGLAEKLAAFNPRTITGDTVLADRQAAVDAFQGDEKVRVIIGTIGAMGVGLTLTEASVVAFAELDWVPANITQAEDRLHRIGQTCSVLVQHLVLDGSLDARMAKRLVAKQAVIDSALDIEHAEKPDALVVAKEMAATHATTREQIEAEAPSFTPEHIAAIHAGLRVIAGMCDGARELDGAGFSKIDSRIGKSLAESQRLSPKQAALGQRLVRKYRRQVPDDVLNAIGVF